MAQDIAGQQHQLTLTPQTHPQVERLAAGLRHEQAFVATALDVSQHDAAHYAGHILGISSVPAVLLYPEAARGFLRFLGEARE